MAEEQGKKEEEKFEFTPEGETLGYISLDQARVLAMRTAREAPGDYGRRFRNIPMAFEVAAEEETEDHYVVTLSLRPQGAFSGSAGQEQFFIEKEGTLEHRQVMDVPRMAGRRFPLIPAAIGLVVLVGVAVVGVVVAGGFGGGDGAGPIPALVPTATPPQASESALPPILGEVATSAPPGISVTSLAVGGPGEAPTFVAQSVAPTTLTTTPDTRGASQPEATGPSSQTPLVIGETLLFETVSHAKEWARIQYSVGR